MAVRDHLRTLRLAAWLGWQIESNWARPALFLLYSFIRPIATTLILVIMYLIIKQDVSSDPAFFSYVYLGATFYMFVSSVVFGITYVIHADREHYQTLRNIYISPVSLYVYIIGRATGKVALAALAVVISMAFGILVLGLPFDPMLVDWPLFAIAMLLGLACLVSLGLALAGISMLTAKHSTSINEGVGGLVYLLCGAVFPHHGAACMGAGHRPHDTGDVLAGADTALTVPWRRDRHAGRPSGLWRPDDPIFPSGVHPGLRRTVPGDVPPCRPQCQAEGEVGHDHDVLAVSLTSALTAFWRHTAGEASRAYRDEGHIGTLRRGGLQGLKIM